MFKSLLKSGDAGNNEIDLERKEDKYILEKQELVPVKNKIETHLDPYYPDPSTQFVINTSIYFDSPDLTFLKQHLNKLEDRRKIRIRTYAPNGTQESIYFIEVKSKSDGKSLKTRLQINKDGLDYILDNNQIKIDNSLMDANMEMEHDEVLKEAKYINYLMLTNKVRPVCRITYKRYAYQANEEFRVTLDQDLKVTPLEILKMNVIQDIKNQDLWDRLKEFGEKFYNQENFLLEVKHIDNEPEWIKTMLQDLKVDPTNFSKYVWSMFQIMNNTLKLLK